MQKNKVSEYLFIDIETVPQYESYNDAPETLKTLWDKKSAQFRKDETPEEAYSRAGIWAEFGLIVCISCGYITENEDKERTIRIKSFAGNDEKLILSDFSDMLGKFKEKRKQVRLCAHNGKEFDFPYICRRMIINGITLPGALNVAGMKPWEVPFVDTMELWKFGDHKNYCSLDLLACILNIPSPKDDIDGSMVARIFRQDNDIERIKTYCEKDVLTVAQIMMRYRNEPLIENVSVV